MEPSAPTSSCELESGCGAGSRSINSLLARSDTFSDLVANASELYSPIPFEDSPLHSLHKRTFRYTLDQNRQYVGKSRPKKGESLSYVVPILNSADGGDTENLNLTWSGQSGADERAYSQFQSFADRAFQIGTNALMGCTVVILVSNEAVWMIVDETFDQRVIQFLKSEDITNPAASPTIVNEPRCLGDPKYKTDFKVYIPPEGPGIDAPRFGSSRGQRTLLFIMAPTRVSSIRSAINGHLNRAPGYAEHKCVTLDPDNVPGDEDKMWNSMRDTMLFQYDPNSDGNGKRAWRL
ncbi:hypothetical protein P154DRAFT_583195 [Amniculicola lignicola CBS 123094]|uniref:Uncharacterized protein n=1 Tax=Amniculicola lignicola CBS 123094 TaxID=1392246 RepID=A0A6A5VYU6_9PLEO|nr:hypothetical protein P154DRAFT_583195 [Amniculicola lignicola CBS 123094]